MQPWTELVPQHSGQSFVNCYGVLEIKGSYYCVSDLVEDDVEQPSQKS